MDSCDHHFLRLVLSVEVVVFLNHIPVRAQFAFELCEKCGPLGYVNDPRAEVNGEPCVMQGTVHVLDRKSTRLNSSHRL